ncbi:MAG: hypothetical protein JWQ17_1547, partial [Tardiphaga sp.]|nr:hypothetical protein [Tardiphaga sp.]
AIGGIYVGRSSRSTHRHREALLIARTGNQRSVQFVGSPASEQSSHHAANQSTWTAAAAVVSTTAAATTGRTVVIGFVAAAEAGLRR